MSYQSNRSKILQPRVKPKQDDIPHDRHNHMNMFEDDDQHNLAYMLRILAGIVVVVVCVIAYFALR